jgi:hypothetical protein
MMPQLGTNLVVAALVTAVPDSPMTWDTAQFQRRENEWIADLRYIYIYIYDFGIRKGEVQSADSYLYRLPM